MVCPFISLNKTKQNTYLFIWLLQALVVAPRIFSCSMQTFSFGVWGLVARSGIQIHAPQWKYRVLTIVPPRNSLIILFFKHPFIPSTFVILPHWRPPGFLSLLFTQLSVNFLPFPPV